MGRYSNKFVLCILVNGQAQKDLANGEVHIPFGSEYVVRLINKNDRRAVVDLVIDGENIGSFVVRAHDRLDVKRSAYKDAAFKFVDLDSPEAYGEGKQGPNPNKEKGLIEARFKLEKVEPVLTKVEHHYHQIPRIFYSYPMSSYGGRNIRYRTTCDVPKNLYQNSPIRGDVCSLAAHSNQCSDAVVPAATGLEALAAYPSSVSSTPLLQEGCTVEGQKTGQQWTDVNIDTENTETVLQLFLKGYTTKISPKNNGVPVQEGPYIGSSQTNMPIVTPPSATPSNFCLHCGTARMSETAKFCGNCGNKL